MAPKFAKRPIVAVEQGETAGAAVDAVNGTINSMPKTTVFSRFHLRSGGEVPEE
jgi:hypothetical protein